jgi:hypothetical protein
LIFHSSYLIIGIASKYQAHSHNENINSNDSEIDNDFLNLNLEKLSQALNCKPFNEYFVDKTNDNIKFKYFNVKFKHFYFKKCLVIN